MQTKEKTSVEIQAEKRQKLVAEAVVKKNKHTEVREAALKLRDDVSKADEKTKDELTKKFEEAKVASAKAKAEYEAAKIKASQYIPIDGEKPELVSKPVEYLPTEKERGHIHVELDQPSYDKQTGKKRSKAFIQKFEAQSFKNFMAQSNNLGYSIKVLWDGSVYKSN